jgi:hypothetical protein
VQVGSGRRAGRIRYSCLKEAARGCGGRGELWELNRFWSQDPCQTGTLVKNLLLILINICLATICVILPPASSVLQAGVPDACVYTRGSVCRASGFVQTGFWDVVRGNLDLAATTNPPLPRTLYAYCTVGLFVCNALITNEILVEAAGVELFSVLTARKLLILRMARGAKKAPLPIPLYVYCTKIFSHFDS